MRPALSALLLLPALAALAATASAEGLPACAGDVQTFCAESRSRGAEAVESCLKVHKDGLSEACKAERAKAAAVPAAPAAPEPPDQPPSCVEDAAKFCKDVKGSISTVVCLKKNAKELSKSCKRKLAESGAERLRAVARICSNERQMLCHGLKTGTPELLRCLFNNRVNATRTCRDAIDQARPYMR